MDILRLKNAAVPRREKPVTSAKFVVDSDDEEPRACSSTGPGTLVGMGSNDEDE